MKTIKWVKLHPDAQLPHYGSIHAAGGDLRTVESTNLLPGEIAVLATGLACEIPQRMEGQIRPRSGLAAKHGITVLNAPGTIDADYRGEIKVILINHGKAPVVINCGDRIAQIVFTHVADIANVLVDSLDDSERGAGGLGSTGV